MLNPTFTSAPQTKKSRQASSYLILRTALTSYRIEFVDKDDRGLLLACRGEEVADALRSDADEHLVEF
jgi:hypothetical protein